jgi:hypothetical protein
MFTPVINFRTIELVTDSYFDPYLILAEVPGVARDQM